MTLQPGIQSVNTAQFYSVSQYLLEMRQTSQDTLSTLVNVRPHEESQTSKAPDYFTCQPGKYIAAMYDAWYMHYIQNRSEEHMDVEVEFYEQYHGQ